MFIRMEEQKKKKKNGGADSHTTAVSHLEYCST